MTGPSIRLPGTDEPIETCITCGDRAAAVTIVEVLADAMAVVDTEAGRETVSIALVAASVGDWILVHAGEAIARLEAAP